MTKLIVIDQEDLQHIVETSMRRVLDAQVKTTDSSNSDYLNLKQACKFLDKAESTIYGLTSRKLIPHRKKRKKLYFLKSELEVWLSQGKQEEEPKVTVKIRKSSNS